ncbi:DUF3649 domain-containing protein [Roseomonas sp. 18066]|uniref:DUF3649 domain-containing protein n=1 Tax=Roseomonas sp. 18066 TaxID=2681412 RepID=UPI00190F742F|nr:DUF3649 domain-containing protein [Roseomonas sp. 18066]
MPSRASELRRVAGIVARLLAGLGGGYAVAAMASAWLATSLPMPRVEAVITATLLSFLILAGCIVWAFAARRLGRMAVGIAILAAILAGLLWLQGAAS